MTIHVVNTSCGTQRIGSTFAMLVAWQPRAYPIPTLEAARGACLDRAQSSVQDEREKWRQRAELLREELFQRSRGKVPEGAENLEELIRLSIGAFERLSAEEQAEERRLQRESWARGELAFGSDADEEAYRQRELVRQGADGDLADRWLCRIAILFGVIALALAATHFFLIDFGVL